MTVLKNLRFSMSSSREILRPHCQSLLSRIVGTGLSSNFWPSNFELAPCQFSKVSTCRGLTVTNKVLSDFAVSLSCNCCISKSFHQSHEGSSRHPGGAARAPLLHEPLRTLRAFERPHCAAPKPPPGPVPGPPRRVKLGPGRWNPPLLAAA